jgi:hypothetical protein
MVAHLEPDGEPTGSVAQDTAYAFKITPKIGFSKTTKQ